MQIISFCFVFCVCASVDQMRSRRSNENLCNRVFERCHVGCKQAVALLKAVDRRLLAFYVANKRLQCRAALQNLDSLRVRIVANLERPLDRRGPSAAAAPPLQHFGLRAARLPQLDAGVCKRLGNEIFWLEGCDWKFGERRDLRVERRHLGLQNARSMRRSAFASPTLSVRQYSSSPYELSRPAPKALRSPFCSYNIFLWLKGKWWGVLIVRRVLTYSEQLLTFAKLFEKLTQSPYSTVNQ